MVNPSIPKKTRSPASWMAEFLWVTSLGAAVGLAAEVGITRLWPHLGLKGASPPDWITFILPAMGFMAAAALELFRFISDSEERYFQRFDTHVTEVMNNHLAKLEAHLDSIPKRMPAVLDAWRLDGYVRSLPFRVGDDKTDATWVVKIIDQVRLSLEHFKFFPPALGLSVLHGALSSLSRDLESLASPRGSTSTLGEALRYSELLLDVFGSAVCLDDDIPRDVHADWTSGWVSLIDSSLSRAREIRYVFLVEHQALGDNTQRLRALRVRFPSRHFRIFTCSPHRLRVGGAPPLLDFDGIDFYGASAEQSVAMLHLRGKPVDPARPQPTKSSAWGNTDECLLSIRSLAHDPLLRQLREAVAQYSVELDADLDREIGDA